MVCIANHPIPYGIFSGIGAGRDVLAVCTVLGQAVLHGAMVRCTACGNQRLLRAVVGQCVCNRCRHDRDCSRCDGNGNLFAHGIAVRREGDEVSVGSHRKISGQIILRTRCPIDRPAATTDCIPLARRLARTRFARARCGAACGQLYAACRAIGYGRCNILAIRIHGPQCDRCDRHLLHGDIAHRLIRSIVPQLAIISLPEGIIRLQQIPDGQAIANYQPLDDFSLSPGGILDGDFAVHGQVVIYFVSVQIEDDRLVNGYRKAARHIFQQRQRIARIGGGEGGVKILVIGDCAVLRHTGSKCCSTFTHSVHDLVGVRLDDTFLGVEKTGSLRFDHPIVLLGKVDIFTVLVKQHTAIGKDCLQPGSITLFGAPHPIKDSVVQGCIFDA